MCAHVGAEGVFWFSFDRQKFDRTRFADGKPDLDNRQRHGKGHLEFSALCETQLTESGNYRKDLRRQGDPPEKAPEDVIQPRDLFL